MWLGLSPFVFFSPAEPLCINSSPNSVASPLLLKSTKHAPTSRPWHLALEQVFLIYPLSIQASVLISPHQRELLLNDCPFRSISSHTAPFLSITEFISTWHTINKVFDLATGYFLSSCTRIDFSWEQGFCFIHCLLVKLRTVPGTSKLANNLFF